MDVTDSVRYQVDAEPIPYLFDVPILPLSTVLKC